MIDTNELRRLAQAATPGGWYVEHGNYVYGCKDVIDGEEEWHPIIACTDDGEPGNFAGNAAFVAAANPAAVAELLDRLEAAEKERDKLKELNIALCTKSNSQVIHNARLAEENDALRAKMAEMERQEPIGWLFDGDFYEVRQMSLYKDNEPLQGQTALYALPGAKGE